MFRGDRPSHYPGSVTSCKRARASAVQHHPTLRRGCSGSSGGVWDGLPPRPSRRLGAVASTAASATVLDFSLRRGDHELRIEEADDDPAPAALRARPHCRAAAGRCLAPPGAGLVEPAAGCRHRGCDKAAWPRRASRSSPFAGQCRSGRRSLQPSTRPWSWTVA